MPAVLWLAMHGLSAQAQAPVNDATIAAQNGVDAAAAASQQAVNQLVDEAASISGEYARTLAEIDSLNQYNNQLQKQVDAQLAEIASIQEQLSEIETTNREVQPLMERMVQTLDQFVKADIPFFSQERADRVARLVALVDPSNTGTAISEKYRQILEAYQIELDYGRSLDSYQGTLPDGKVVQFIRLGRVSLMYRTLDGQETGYWDANSKTWVQDNSYLEAIGDALSVANQEGAPDLLRVPVPAPRAAQ
ncbi:MAG: DUF3450 domain-containing protein [Pseudomonadales bacterium]|jgi:flagellar motility protein MotE (MotC chaperone)|nr:DUF3450 domain-containing protein [Pseudomonadales bacterium]